MDTNVTILVIEDSPVVQHLIRVTLTPLGVNLVTADDGESGLEAMRAHLPDLIVLDIGLPGIDGWQVLSELRSNAETSDIGVIVLTAHAQKSMEQAAFEGGANLFMTKPFRPDELRLEAGALLAHLSSGVAVGL